MFQYFAASPQEAVINKYTRMIKHSLQKKVESPNFFTKNTEGIHSPNGTRYIHELIFIY